VRAVEERGDWETQSSRAAEEPGACTGEAAAGEIAMDAQGLREEGEGLGAAGRGGKDGRTGRAVERCWGRRWELGDDHRIRTLCA
jgi:hypothetical protein